MACKVCMIALILFMVVTVGSGRSVNFTKSSPPTPAPVLDDDAKTTAKTKLPLPVMAMRWIPGGLSIGIFVSFTIAASVKVYLDKDEPAKKQVEEEGAETGAEIAEVDFFKMDVIGKLKPGKKNIFQRRLLQNKQKKFSVYDKMMRQYKDDVIAKRAQDARHAEIQKEKEEKERQKEAEIAEQKKRAIEEHKRNTIRRKQEKLRLLQEGGNASGAEDDGCSDGTLTPAVSFARGDQSGESGTASDRSITPNSSDNILMAKAESSRNSSPKNIRATSEDGQDTGIMLKMKNSETIAETSFTTTDSSDESQRRTQQKKASLTIPRLNFQSTEESDDSMTEYKPTNDGSTALTPSTKDEPAMDQLQVHGDEYADEARDVITPLRRRPLTWSEADFPDEEQVQQRLSSTSSVEDEDENTKKFNAMIDRFAQNARESRGIVELEDDDEVCEAGPSTGLKKKKKMRPRTWSYGASYGEEGKTDSITELMATIMNLGPSKPSGGRRRSRPLIYEPEDEEMLLDELEQRMIDAVQGEEMARDDILVLEKLMSDVANFHKDY